MQLHHDSYGQIAEALPVHAGVKAAELRTGRDREPDHGE